MNEPDKPADGRPFRPISVGTCYSQTADERFGRGASQAIREQERNLVDPWMTQLPLEWAVSDSQSEADDPATAHIPKMQRFRNNLTALSQMHNLYFVAYMGQIFAYVPRSVPKQTIPQTPDVKLDPPQTFMGRRVGGCQDITRPHSINHILVGMLGEQEIVVASYDDGDVVAYYTQEIADHARGLRSVPRPGDLDDAAEERLPTPLFHQNVGKSAWGLAVHQASRLIAVSSNHREVTVFALALFTLKEEDQGRDVCPSCTDGKACGDIESHVRLRARGWRIVIRMGPTVDNMPNISFVDDDDGSAELICAVDIKGAVWLAHIWKPCHGVLRVAPSPSLTSRDSDAWPSPSRGWGILPLARSDFARAHSLEQLLGLPPDEMEDFFGSGVSIARGLRRIPDNPCVPLVPQRLFLPHNLGLQWFLGEGEDAMQLESSETEHEVDVEAAMPAAGGDLHAGGDDGDDSDDSDDADDADDGVDEDDDQDGEDDDSDDDEYEGVNDDSSVSQGTGVGTALVVATSEYPTSMTTTAPPPTNLNESPQPAQPSPVMMMGPPVTGWTTHVANPSPVPFLSTLYRAVAGHKAACGDEPSALGRPKPVSGKLAAQMNHCDMVYWPHVGRARMLPQRKAEAYELIRRPRESNENRRGNDATRDKFAKRFHILRLHERELELRCLLRWESGKRHELGVFCPQALTLGTDVQGDRTWMLFHATNRLSMVTHVPDLSLVVVGSPMGRVLLVTPTRLDHPVDWRTEHVQHGFRIDCVLPRLSDDKVHRKTMRPLHGMAVGPVQEDVVGGGQHDAAARRACGPRRYRLMLHYRNHDILTYEMSRDRVTSELCIF